MLIRKFALSISVAAFAGLFSVANANAGPGMGSTVGECYNNWISHCNENTAGYPNSCYEESLDLCDEHHGAMTTTLSPTQLKAAKTTALTRAKRATTPEATRADTQVDPVPVRKKK